MFPAKDPDETVVLTFDASAALESGETLVSVSTTEVGLDQGADPSPSTVVSEAQINAAAMTAGGITVGARQGVTALAQGGYDGCNYLVRITCTTTNPNKILTLKGVLPVSIQP